MGVTALRGMSIRTPLPTSPLSGGRSISGQGGGASMGRGGRSVNGPSAPPSSPPPCRGRVGVGVTGVAGRVHPDPPPDLPPVRGEEYGWSGGKERQRPLRPPLLLPPPCRGRVGVGVTALRGGIRTPLPTSPLEYQWAGGRSVDGQGGRSVDGPSRPPLLLPLPCRGRVGVGVTALRGGIRTPLPTSPLSGGRSIGGRGEEYGWSGGEGASTAPPVPLFFSLSLAGGGSGWGSRRRHGIRTPLPTSPLSGGRSIGGQGGGVWMVRGEERQQPLPSPLLLPLPCRGRVGVGVTALRGASIRTPLPTSPLSGGRSVGGRGEEYGWSGGEGASTAPPVPLFFSLSLAGGGSGWGSRRCGVASGPPSRPPPCQGGGVSVGRGEVGVGGRGSRQGGAADIRGGGVIGWPGRASARRGFGRDDP